MSQPEVASPGPAWPPLLNPSNHTTATYDQARQYLQSARARLSHAITDYLAACGLVEMICAKPTRFSNRQSCKRALGAIDVELSTLFQEEDKIQEARVLLKDTRNRSKMVSPIYSLPSEILTQVFLNAVCHCTSEISFQTESCILNPVTLSGVCRLWRALAVDCRSLWTHIDLVIGGSNGQSYPPSTLWIARSRGAPLHLHILQYRTLFEWGHTRVEDHRRLPNAVLELLHFLSVLLPQACSLEIIFTWPMQYLLDVVMEYWVKHGTVGMAKTLTVRSIPKPHDPKLTHLELPTSDLTYLPLHRHSQYKEFFQTLEVLRFRGPVSSWFALSFSNLVELELEGGSAGPPSKVQLASIITSCPKLRYVTLDCLKVTPGLTVPPVTLSELRLLRLGESALIPALSLIDPGPHALSLDITLPSFRADATEALAGFYSFLDRANVAILRVRATRQPYFARQIGPLPGVKTLALKNFYLSDATRPAHHSTKRTETRSNLFPTYLEFLSWRQLKELYLFDCTLERNHLHRLASFHSIQVLYLSNCYEYGSLREKLENGTRILEKFKERLSDVIPQIVCVDGGVIRWPPIGN